VADPADWDVIIEVESLTNPRLRDEIGEITLVPPDERIAGPGASGIMAAFTHLNPDGSRFTDGTFGVFYASNDVDTAIAETTYHRERFMRATSEGPMHLDMRVYLTDLDADLHELRGLQVELPLVYHADNYAAGQSLAKTLRGEGSNGIVYTSVRRAGGECAALFPHRALSNCRRERHLAYVWDGVRIRDVYERSLLVSQRHPQVAYSPRGMIRQSWPPLWSRPSKFKSSMHSSGASGCYRISTQCRERWSHSRRAHLSAIARRRRCGARRPFQIDPIRINKSDDGQCRGNETGRGTFFVSPRKPAREIAIYLN
jgi:hypothetical protein